jgi:hypothetical protein
MSVLVATRRPSSRLRENRTRDHFDHEDAQVKPGASPTHPVRPPQRRGIFDPRTRTSHVWRPLQPNLCAHTAVPWGA